MKRRQISLIGSGENNPQNGTAAYEIGRFIAKNGWVLITGGKGGIMEAASKGAHEEKGITVGIIPESAAGAANKHCSIVIPTGVGHARNMINILSGDAVVAISGGWGTLSEIAYSQIFDRPVILCEFTGGWSKILSEKPGSEIKQNFHVAEKLEDVFRILSELSDQLERFE
ncbi:MAG: TIGR00725 family protein [Spirochaetes bacterium]|jgi:hypothetical protein|nr:TIGR00725 family protein [Spirochaetota bacterium]